MIPIYILIASLSVCSGVAIAIALIWRRTSKESSARANTAEKAYAELTAQSAFRERTLIAERNHVSAAGGRVMNELVDAIRDADRLAPIVEQFIKDIDDTARLLKDDKAPALTAEREAIRLHQELIKSRAHEATN